MFVEAQEQPAGGGRAAAARAAADDAGRARQAHLRVEHQPRGTITRSAPGTTRTVAGRSASGSPSAYIVKGRSALTSITRPLTKCTKGSSRWVPLNTFRRLRRKSSFEWS